jgi:hypothetical protein
MGGNVAKPEGCSRIKEFGRSCQRRCVREVGKTVPPSDLPSEKVPLTASQEALVEEGIASLSPEATALDLEDRSTNSGKKNKRNKKGAKKASATPAAASAQASNCSSRQATTKGCGSASVETPAKEEVGPQFTLDEALKLYRALKSEFAEETFQKVARCVREKYPNRHVLGHSDGNRFSTDMQAISVNVYNKVLPRKPWKLPTGVAGHRQMNARTSSVADHPQVIELRNEIQGLLHGLSGPIDVARQPEQPLLIEKPDGSGGVEWYSNPLLADCDGDLAHEFWVEDLASGGSLRRADFSASAAVAA